VNHWNAEEEVLALDANALSTLLTCFVAWIPGQPLQRSNTPG
jgi:hypothetical protein